MYDQRGGQNRPIRVNKRVTFAVANFLWDMVLVSLPRTNGVRFYVTRGLSSFALCTRTRFTGSSSIAASAEEIQKRKT